MECWPRRGVRWGSPQGWAGSVITTPALHSWYFSGLSRTQAQQLLLSPEDALGSFLLRPSESSQGNY